MALQALGYSSVLADEPGQVSAEWLWVAEGVKLALGWSQLALHWLLPDTGTRLPGHS